MAKKYKVNFIKDYKSDGKEIVVTIIKDAKESQFKITAIEGKDISKIRSNFSATFRQFLKAGATEGEVTYWAMKPGMTTSPKDALENLKIPMIAEEDIKDLLQLILLKLKGFDVDKGTIINYINENNITNITDVKVEGDTIIINGNRTPIKAKGKVKRDVWRWTDFCAEPTEEEKKEYYRTHFPKRKQLAGEVLIFALSEYHKDTENFKYLIKFMKDPNIVLESLEEE